MTEKASTPKSKKTPPDWERIKADYRADQLTNREIGRQHNVSEGAVRKKAKVEGWEKDLSSRVREKVRTELVRTVRTVMTLEGAIPTDEEIIDEAAARGVDVVRGHMKHIGEAMEMTNTLMFELRQSTRDRAEIEEDIEALTIDDKTDKRRARMMAAVSLPSRTGVLKDLTATIKTIVGLERQAFNLNEKGEGDEESDICTMNRATLETIAKRG